MPQKEAPPSPCLTLTVAGWIFCCLVFVGCSDDAKELADVENDELIPSIRINAYTENGDSAGGLR